MGENLTIESEGFILVYWFKINLFGIYLYIVSELLSMDLLKNERREKLRTIGNLAGRNQ